MTEQEKDELQEKFNQVSKTFPSNETELIKLEKKYHEIIATGYSSGAYLNLAKIQLALNKKGQAIHTATQATLKSPFDKKAQENLKLIKSQVENGLAAKINHPSELAFKIYPVIKPIDCISISSIFLLLTFLLIYLKKSKAIYFSCIFLSIIFFCSSFFISSAKKLITTTTQSKLYSDPLESSEVIEKLIDGTRLRIINETTEFIQVERPGIKGWLKKENNIISLIDHQK